MNIRKEIEKNEILEKVLEDGEQIAACVNNPPPMTALLS